MNNKKALKIWKSENVDVSKIPIEFWSDKSFIIEAIKLNGFALQYVNKKFLKDPEIVLEAIKQEPATLKFADKIFTVSYTHLTLPTSDLV